MTFRCKQRGLHVRLTTLVVAACTMVALLALMAQAASAYVPCPTREARAGNITGWVTLAGRTRETARGVTLCRANWISVPQGYLQIVDATDGARIRLQTEVDPSGEPAEPEQPNTLFVKRSAAEWYNFLRGMRREEQTEIEYMLGAPAERLFSTTNATFFKDTNPLTGSTRLPLPFLGWPWKDTLGVAFTRRSESELDWTAPKKIYSTGYPTATPQPVDVGAFPTYYPEPWGPEGSLYWEAVGVMEEAEAFEAAVGFSPEYRIGERSRRNYVGTYGYITYIFTSRVEYTNAQMRSIMQEIQPGMDVVQMDGGGSAQIYAPSIAEMPSNVPVTGRPVPNVFAIYRGP
jgi:hypothetical protein